MSAAWMSGYVGDVAYTLGFYRELAPSFLNFACLVNGFEGLRKSEIRYCELGCGRGYGTALLAAANPDCEFVGIDFNPTHVAEARETASSAGLRNVTFLESSFAEAARSTDPKLAEFDVIVLHGVYSWVARNIREDIREFIRTKLLPGGIAFVSYNCLPGWATAISVQKMFIEVAERFSGDSLSAITRGQQVLKTLVEKNSGFVTQNPAVKARLARMEEQDKHYLVHEFLNVGWEALFVTDVMAALSEAKLTYVGSATIAENRLDFCVPKNLQDLVRSAPDLALRELYKDYVLNKQFRRDIYVKGPISLSQRKQQQRLDGVPLAYTFGRNEVPEKWRMPIGDFSPNAKVAGAITSRLQKGLATGKELIAIAQQQGAAEGFGPVLLEMLVHRGIACPARPDHDSVDRSAAHRFNAHVFNMTMTADTHRFLAAPVLGSAIPSAFVERIITPIVLENPSAKPDEIARQAFDRLKAVGQAFHQSGKPLAGTDENVKEIAGLVSQFCAHSLPHWQTLGVVGKTDRAASNSAASTTHSRRIKAGAPT